LSFDGSMRSWLKYIGRALQLLTSDHDAPLLSERRIPPRPGLTAGGAGFGSFVSPRPRPNPRPGPALLHQS
jgi:hypothetical protein